jgi:CRP/FNR family transcriptional regulator, cyclic AMP receptor protein
MSGAAARTRKQAANDPMASVVQALASHGIVRSYPKHAVIITEGDPSDSLYVILSGRVKVYLGDSSGKEVVLDVHGPGSYVGEMAFDNQPRSASVMTLEPCTLSVVTQSRFREFLKREPEAVEHLIRNLIQRARTATQNVRSLALLDVYGRVARLLLELAEEQDGRLVVAQPLTQQDIAHRVGCSREMVSRLFKDLVAGGYLTVEGRRIFLKRALPNRW